MTILSHRRARHPARVSHLARSAVLARLSRLARPAVLAGAAIALVVALASPAAPAGAASTPTPHLAHPAAAAKPLVHKFFALLQNKNVPGLKRFLAAGFQIQRADGSADGKATYLTKLPTIQAFSNSAFTASQANGALVVRYLSEVTGIANGKPYTPGPAPRLSVFTWNGSRWQLAAHANFNPLTS